MKTYQDRHPRLRAPPHDQQQRDDQTDDYSDLDVPDDGKDESERHERHIDPGAHPIIERRHRYMFNEGIKGEGMAGRTASRI